MTTIAQARKEPPGLLFIFTLPTKHASQRVGTWRKLRRYGALTLKSGMKKNFPGLNDKVNTKLLLLYVSRGLDDFLLKSNREFEDWLKSHNIRFVDVETSGYAHVWAIGARV